MYEINSDLIKLAVYLQLSGQVKRCERKNTWRIKVSKNLEVFIPLFEKVDGRVCKTTIEKKKWGNREFTTFPIQPRCTALIKQLADMGFLFGIHGWNIPQIVIDNYRYAKTYIQASIDTKGSIDTGVHTGTYRTMIRFSTINKQGIKQLCRLIGMYTGINTHCHEKIRDRRSPLYLLYVENKEDVATLLNFLDWKFDRSKNQRKADWIRNRFMADLNQPGLRFLAHQGDISELAKNNPTL